MKENHLLYINENYPAITWMNAVVEGKPVTPRYGYVVEVNALWYNASCLHLKPPAAARDKKFVEKWTL
jgi:glycogen debranching enzyme